MANTARGIDQDCRYCRWWQPLMPDAREADMPRGPYDCRRHAPVVCEVQMAGSLMAGMGPITRWPQTSPNDGCGDFERYRGPDGQPARSGGEVKCARCGGDIERHPDGSGSIGNYNEGHARICGRCWCQDRMGLK